MAYGEAKKLGISWSDICDLTGGNVYAVNEGIIDDTDIIDVSISLISSN